MLTVFVAILTALSGLFGNWINGLESPGQKPWFRRLRPAGYILIVAIGLCALSSAFLADLQQREASRQLSQLEEIGKTARDGVAEVGRATNDVRHLSKYNKESLAETTAALKGITKDVTKSSSELKKIQGMQTAVFRWEETWQHMLDRIGRLQEVMQCHCNSTRLNWDRESSAIIADESRGVPRRDGGRVKARYRLEIERLMSLQQMCSKQLADYDIDFQPVPELKEIHRLYVINDSKIDNITQAISLLDEAIMAVDSDLRDLLYQWRQYKHVFAIELLDHVEEPSPEMELSFYDDWRRRNPEVARNLRLTPPPAAGPHPATRSSFRSGKFLYR